MHEKQLRVRYIRVLEKFFTRTVSLLRLENFNKELFKERTKKNYEDIKKVKAVDLNSAYLTQLIAFINKTLEYAENSSEDFQDERTALLKEANLIQKEKKRNTYKRNKHKKSNFDDGY